MYQLYVHKCTLSPWDDVGIWEPSQSLTETTSSCEAMVRLRFGLGIACNQTVFKRARSRRLKESLRLDNKEQSTCDCNAF